MVALVAAVLVAGGVLYARVPRDRLAVTTPGTLSVATDTLGQYRFGQYRLDVRAGGSIQVVGDDGLVVWSNQPGHAFLTGSASPVSWQTYRGYFWSTVSVSGSWPDQRLTRVMATPDSVVLQGQLLGAGKPASWLATLRPRAAGGVTLTVTTPDRRVDALGFSSGRSHGAGVHGFGEQFSPFDLSGRLFALVDREQGIGRGEQPLTLLADMFRHGAGGTEAMTYDAAVTFVTNDLRGVRLAPSSPSATAFAIADTRDPDRVDVTVWARTLQLELTAARSPQALVAEQQGPLHRPPLATWTQHGLIVGVQGGTDRVRRIVARLRRGGVPLAGVWIQDWTGERTTGFGQRVWWTWQLDRSLYPGWRSLVQQLGREGIRVTTYVNPRLVDSAGRPGANLWAQARRDGYLVRDSAGHVYDVDQGGFTASLVDLSNPKARDWFAHVIARYVLADGVAGFMADFGDGLPMDARLAHGSAAVMHDRWPGLWAQTVRHACLLAHLPDCVTWFRAGSPGVSADTPMFWNGDQLVDFSSQDGLASVLLGTFSAGVSGWPLVHSDLGGYTSVSVVVKNYVRPPELLQRWGQLAAFGVMMRSHESNRPQANQQVYDPDEIGALARNVRIFAALAPYRASVIAEATRRGIPAVRPVWLNYPHSAAAADDREFFLGSSILVAPVLAGGAPTVQVAFPPGTWVDPFTDRRYAGNRTTTVPAPLTTPDAFIRADDPWLPKVRASLRAAGLVRS